LKRYVEIVTLAIITFLLFSNTLNHQYVYDDYPFIVNNRFVQQGIEGIPAIFSSSYWDGNENLHNVHYTSYRPLPIASFALEQHLFGDNTFPKHFVQILIYIILVLLIYCLLQLLLSNKIKHFAFLVCLIFCTHPLHSEIVANLKSRDELLALLFLVLSFIAAFQYIKKSSIVLLTFASFWFLLALLCKESIAIMGIAFPLLFWMHGEQSIKSSILKTLPFVLSLGVFFSLKYLAIGKVGISASVSAIDNPFVFNERLVDYIIAAFYTTGLLFSKLVFPFFLQYDYSFGEILPNGNSFAIAAFGVFMFLALLIGIYYTYKKHRSSFWWLCLLFVSILFLGNFLMDNVAAFAERFLFVPSLFFCVLLAQLILFIAQKLTKQPQMVQRYFYIAIGAFILLFSIKTYSRNAVWENNETLFTNDINLADKSVRANYHYANLLLDQYNNTSDKEKKQLILEAERYLNRANAVLPKNLSFIELHLKRARVFELKGNFKEALATYQFCLKQPGDMAMTHNQTGKFYLRQQQFDKAKKQFEQVIELQPTFGDAYANLGAIYGRENDLERSIIFLKKAIELNYKDKNAHKNLIEAYRILGDEKNRVFYQKQLQQIGK